MDSGLKFLFGSGLNRELTRGVMPLADTSSAGLRLTAVGFKGIWTHQIVQYPFS
jgi:hypothetical protein